MSFSGCNSAPSSPSNSSYMKSENENRSIQKNRRERRFSWENAYFFLSEFCWFFWNDSLTRPHTGNTHFYLNVRLGPLRTLKCVNALTRATLISTDCQRFHRNRSGSVNALTQATLISTLPFKFDILGEEVSMPSHGQHSFLLYPLKCPCFMRIIDPIFAGNSLNILKKALFPGFTCMFTVCSYLKFLPELFWLYHFYHLVSYPSFLSRSIISAILHFSHIRKTVVKIRKIFSEKWRTVYNPYKEPLQTHRYHFKRK